MKTVLFIPGFKEGLHDRDYSSVLEVFKSRGYQVKFVPLNWVRTDANQWVKEFDSIYGNYEPGDTVLAGFSFGAVTAFLAAAKRNPSELWLCSLSPYFKGDNPKMSWLKHIGRRRAEVFTHIDFPSLAKKIKCRTRILYGDLEVPEVKHRAKEAHKLIKNSTITEVTKTRHDIAASEYLKMLQKI